MTPVHPDVSTDVAARSRNAPCPCGSGKRYKHCCGGPHKSSRDSAESTSPPSIETQTGAKMISALAAQLRGDLEVAGTLYREVLLVEPENIDALHMLGVIHFTRGDLNEAERLIRYADSLCPEPIRIIQHNLRMLRERIAATDQPTESLEAIRVDADDSPIARVDEIFGTQEIGLPALSIDSKLDPCGVCSTHEQKSWFPSIMAFELENAVVDAESAIPATRTSALIDDHFDPLRYQSPEWRYGLYRPGNADAVIERVICADSFTHSHLPRAIVLTSDYWTNWAHFLTEVLPKALIADRRAQWSNWPMLISSARLRNAEELLRLLLTPDRHIVKAHGRMLVEQAGYVSSVGFCPIEYTYDWKFEHPKIRPTDCIFSPYALDLVRSATQRLTPRGPKESPRLLYLRRNSATRRFVNQDDVESVFRARGFQVVVPETLSAQQQVELFSHARVIAGPTGAAIANLVFAPRGCRILVLAAFNRHWPFHYWLNMANAAGHDLQYLFGRAVGSSPHPAHPDLFFDDLPALVPVIDAAMKKAKAS